MKCPTEQGDQALQYSDREQCWVIGSVFFVPYICDRPLTGEKQESLDLLMPLLESSAESLVDGLMSWTAIEEKLDWDTGKYSHEMPCGGSLKVTNTRDRLRITH